MSNDESKIAAHPGRRVFGFMLGNCKRFGTLRLPHSFTAI